MRSLLRLTLLKVSRKSVDCILFTAIILATTVPIFSNIANRDAYADWQAYTLKVDDKTYPALWKVSGGKLVEMHADLERKSIIVTIDSKDTGIDGGTLDIRLARALINTTDDNSFIAYLDGQSAQVNQTYASIDYRDLQVHFNHGTKEIRIAGTEIVPEFSFAVFVLVVSIVGAILAVNRFRIRR